LLPLSVKRNLIELILGIKSLGMVVFEGHTVGGVLHGLLELIRIVIIKVSLLGNSREIGIGCMLCKFIVRGVLILIFHIKM
jgi:hypothetical protein